MLWNSLKRFKCCITRRFHIMREIFYLKSIWITLADFIRFSHREGPLWLVSLLHTEDWTPPHRSVLSLVKVNSKNIALILTLVSMFLWFILTIRCLFCKFVAEINAMKVLTRVLIFWSSNEYSPTVHIMWLMLRLKEKK